MEGKTDDAAGGSGSVVAEERGEVPVEVAGEVGGDEELGVEGWGECWRGEEMSQDVDVFPPLRLRHWPVDATSDFYYIMIVFYYICATVIPVVQL